jgi:hypothetical protein
MKLSDQALSCVMVALQKSLMEQTDIVPLLKGFEMVLEGEELVVNNPPSSMSMTAPPPLVK